MSEGLHNVSSGILLRLAGCQTEELRPEWREVRRRFWAKVDAPDSDNACWLWVASRFSGGRYGQFMWAERFGRTRPVGAHRVAYELTHGVELPDDCHVLHSCDTGLCVNPAHLFTGTHTDNMRDAASKGRLHVPRPKNQKITDAQCDELVALVRSGVPQYVAAARFGISAMLASLIVRGKRRQHRSQAVSQMEGAA